jgi:hypothetical protein
VIPPTAYEGFASQDMTFLFVPEEFYGAPWQLLRVYPIMAGYTVELGIDPLLVCNEMGYIPFVPEAAALFYALVANWCERASVIVSSNKPFSAWTEIFGDAVAVVDRLVHHAEFINLKGESYRLKDRRRTLTTE